MADSILDPLSWLLENYVCKAKGADVFAPVRLAATSSRSWGNGEVGGWLESGVRSAIDALVDAATHLTAATTSLATVNDALEQGGIARTRQAAQAISSTVSTLDNALALQNTGTKADWLTIDTSQQLDALAIAVVGR